MAGPTATATTAVSGGGDDSGGGEGVGAGDSGEQATPTECPLGSLPRARRFLRTPMVHISSRDGRGLEVLLAGLRSLRAPDWVSRRQMPLLMAVDGCHSANSASSAPMLREDDPWANTPPQEVPHLLDGPVVSATVLQGTIHITGAADDADGAPTEHAADDPPRSPPGSSSLAASPHTLLACSPIAASPLASSPLASLARESPGPRPSARPLLIGPGACGEWSAVSIISIKYKELSVGGAGAGQTATFCLHVHDRDVKLRRGMYITDARPARLPRGEIGEISGGDGGYVDRAHWEFDVDVIALSSTRATVCDGAEVVAHSLGVKQTARVTRVGAHPSNGPPTNPAHVAAYGADSSTAPAQRLRLRFVHGAECLLVGAPCILRDGAGGSHDDARLFVGRVTAISPGTPT